MSVKAKFQVGAIEDAKGYYGDGKTIKMFAVIGTGNNEDENTRFFNSTPTGTIELICVNPKANEQFAQGKQYYVTFEEA